MRLGGFGIGAAGRLRFGDRPVQGPVGPHGRRPVQKGALVVPILSNLDRSIEEPNDEFAGATEIRPEDLQTASSDYVVGKNDLVNISISDLVAPGVDTVKTSRISESGNVSLPLIGPIKAEGLTEAQLERAISKAYRDANVIQNAQVSATIAEARGRTFSILGAVVAPGQYVILNSDFRILDALVLARDTTVPQLDYLYVIRDAGNTKPAAAPAVTPAVSPATQPGIGPDVLQPQSLGRDRLANRTAMLRAGGTPGPSTSTGPDGQYITLDGKQVMVNGGPAEKPPVPATAPVAATTRPAVAAQPVESLAPSQPDFEFNELGAVSDRRIIRVPLAQLRQGDLRYNIVIRPQDMILVPQPIAGEYYMGGHVARVGVYSLTNRKITLKQAIISAGMLDQIAIPARTDIIRRIGPDKEVMASVDLDKVFAGEQPDLYLKPNDQVNVGTNALAPFLAAIRGAFRFTYGFGFLYDRNYAYPKNQQGR